MQLVEQWVELKKFSNGFRDSQISFSQYLTRIFVSLIDFERIFVFVNSGERKSNLENLSPYTTVYQNTGWPKSRLTELHFIFL